MHDVYKHFEVQREVKSATSPRAQSVTLLQLNSPSTADNFDVHAFVSSQKGLQKIDQVVIELMALWGLRVSEVLNITCSDVSKSGNIRIKALKGSNFRIVRSSMFAEWWINADSSLLPISTVYSRFYFYRLFKRIGLYGKFGSNDNNSVTHYFRHLQGLDVQNSFNDWALTASALGHKNEKSTIYYGQKKRE
jgi:integrase